MPAADKGAADLEDEEISEEQDLENDEQKQRAPGKTSIVLKFFCKCPFGTCSKGSQRLGQKGWYTEERAREAIVNHLTASPFHQITKEEAEYEAYNAEIDSWEVEEWPDEPVPEPKCAPKSRAMPGKQLAIQQGHQPQQGSQAVAMIKNLRGDLTSKIQQQTQNAYVFVKASIACTTFDIYIFIYIYIYVIWV